MCCLEWFICWAAAAWWAAVSVSRAVLGHHFIRATLSLNYFLLTEEIRSQVREKFKIICVSRAVLGHHFIRATLPLNYF